MTREQLNKEASFLERHVMLTGAVTSTGRDKLRHELECLLRAGVGRAYANHHVDVAQYLSGVLDHIQLHLAD